MQYRVVWHDRHFSAASNFQIGVSRCRGWGPMEAGECLAPIAHHLEPAVTAVEALRDGGGWPAALHQFGPEQALGTVRLTEASLSN